MTDAPAVVLYDGDCGLCRWAIGVFLAWDRGGHLDPVPISSARGGDLLADLDEEARLASWHLVTGGERLSGGGALAPLFRLLPGGAPLARLFDFAPGLAESAYCWVARHREQIGRLVPAGARRRADRQIEQRSRTVPQAGARPSAGDQADLPESPFRRR